MNNLDLIRAYHKLMFFLEKETITRQDMFKVQDMNCCVDFYLHLYDKLKFDVDFQKDIKLYNNWKARKRYFHNKIKYYLDNYDNLYFMTFTFNNDTLKNLNSSSRYQKVVRWLKQYCVVYVANIDFGSKNEREHYHALVSLNDTSILQDSTKKDKFGHIIYNIKKEFYYNGKVGFTSAIEIYDKNYLKLSHYIDKLANHAFKDTTENHKIIYSRFSKEEKAKYMIYCYNNFHIKLNIYGYITNYNYTEWHKKKKIKFEEIQKFINDNNLDIEDLFI